MPYSSKAAEPCAEISTIMISLLKGLSTTSGCWLGRLEILFHRKDRFTNKVDIGGTPDWTSIFTIDYDIASHNISMFSLSTQGRRVDTRSSLYIQTWISLSSVKNR